MTCAVELPIVAWVAARGLRRRAAIDSLAANLLTHPLAWCVGGAGWASWYAIEAGVMLVEVLVYRVVTGLGWRRALVAGGLANAATAALSFVL